MLKCHDHVCFIQCGTPSTKLIASEAPGLWEGRDGSERPPSLMFDTKQIWPGQMEPWSVDVGLPVASTPWFPREEGPWRKVGSWLRMSILEITGKAILQDRVPRPGIVWGKLSRGCSSTKTDPGQLVHQQGRKALTGSGGGGGSATGTPCGINRRKHTCGSRGQSAPFVGMSRRDRQRRWPPRPVSPGPL